MNVDNYWLIFILPAVSTIFATAIGNKFMGYIEEISYLDHNRFGFRRSKSTQDVLLNLCIGLYANLDLAYFCAVLFIDTRIKKKGLEFGEPQYPFG